jgi:hypothetical protein
VLTAIIVSAFILVLIIGGLAGGSSGVLIARGSYRPFLTFVAWMLLAFGLLFSTGFVGDDQPLVVALIRPVLAIVVCVVALSGLVHNALRLHREFIKPTVEG